MTALAAIFGAGLGLLVLVDAFNTVVLARRVPALFRLARLFYIATWRLYAAAARRIRNGAYREHFLSIYGALSLLALFAVWAISLIAAFAALQWAAGFRFDSAPRAFSDCLYLSASTFFTLGLFSPSTAWSRLLIVLEAAVGLGYLALVISYLPVFYQSYAGRETRISTMDARAGSPFSAVELILRQGPNPDRLREDLKEWENWAADLLQHHLSYPMLAYFRSQHKDQSWLSVLVMVLDVSALAVCSASGDLQTQAGFTFAVARHTLIDLESIFRPRMQAADADRLPPGNFGRLRTVLSSSRSPLRSDALKEEELRRLRGQYEHEAGLLGNYLLVALPPWAPEHPSPENWRDGGFDHPETEFAVSDPYRE